MGLWWYWASNSQQTLRITVDSTPIKSSIKKQEHLLPSRSPASKYKGGVSIKTSNQLKKFRTKLSKKFSPDENPGYHLGKNYSLTKDIRAIASHVWKPERGEKIYSNQYFTFYKASYEDDLSWPVAFDRISKTLHPVSHILHIKKATELDRQEIASLGLKEYYFNHRLKLLSVETTPDTVLTAYTSLQEKGMDVRMEVLRDAPQAK